LNKPDRLLSEAIISHHDHAKIQRYQRLNEEKIYVTSVLQESIGDIVAKVAMQIGVETGKAGQGIAKGMWDAIYPIAKRVAGAGVEAASDTLAWARDNAQNITSSAGKLVGNTVKGGREAFASLKDGLASGLDYKKLAKKDPNSYVIAYEAIRTKLLSVGAPAKTAKAAAAALGVFETEDGQDALAHGAKKAGMSPEELKSLLSMYVLQSKYIDLAMKSKEAKSKNEKQTA
jgi:hypothetical protein